MKKILCPFCGRSDIVKMEKIFYCKYDGAAFSLEEVMEMIVEAEEEPAPADTAPEQPGNADSK